MKAIRPGAAALLTLLLSTSPALAQSGNDGDSGWDNSFFIYLLAPTINGTVGIGPIDGDLDIDAGTVFGALDGAFLGGWAAEKGDWGMLLDLVYMDLSEDFVLAGDRIPGELGNKQLTAGLSVTYRLTDTLQLTGGLMYNDISMKITLDGPLQSQPRRADAGDSWVDPMIGLRYVTPISERWSFAGFGQIGGFGVGSDLTWQLTGSFGFQMSEHSSLLLGYRYMSFDYDDGTGIDRFKFDIAEYGPAVGFRFDF